MQKEYGKNIDLVQRKKENLLKATEMVNLDHILILIYLKKLLQTALILLCGKIPKLSIISNI